MALPFAALYDIVLGTHQIAGLALILIAVALTVFSALSRSREEHLEKAMPLAKLAGPLFGLVLLTGAYQLIDLGIGFFELWVIGALLLGIGFMGTLHGTWRPRAQAMLDGEIAEQDRSSAASALTGLAASMIVMLAVATYLMETGA